MKRTFLIAALAMVLGFAAIPLRADSITIDFIGGSGGTLSFDPTSANTTLSVVNAPLNQVFLTSLGLGSADTIVGGLLNFTTGTMTTGSTDALNDYTAFFANGGSFTISGAIPALGISDPTTQLVGGTFAALPGTMTGNFAMLAPASGNGTFSGLLYLTSFNNTLYNAFFGTDYVSGSGSVADPMLAVNYTAGTYSGGISSTNVKITVPEPANLLLMGAGLVLTGWVMRRRLERRLN